MLTGVYTMHSSEGSLCEDEGSNAGSNVSDSGLKQSLKSPMITIQIFFFLFQCSIPFIQDLMFFERPASANAPSQGQDKTSEESA